MGESIFFFFFKPSLILYIELTYQEPQTLSPLLNANSTYAKQGGKISQFQNPELFCHGCD